MAAEHLKQNGARGKEVRARVHRVSGDLLRRHVLWRADHQAGRGEPRGGHAGHAADVTRETEVEQLDPVRGQYADG
jgi:hypothetical protein